MYYLRSKAAVDPIKFTLAAKHQRKFDSTEAETSTINTQQTQNGEAEMQMSEGAACNMDDGCLSCGA